jgi:TonB family protein
MARRLRVEGEVILSILVDETGNVVETHVAKGVRQAVGINEAAIEAARGAQFRPATKGGVRVKMWTTLRIPFKL